MIIVSVTKIRVETRNWKGTREFLEFISKSDSRK
jgi:hypothetical protein